MAHTQKSQRCEVVPRTYWILQEVHQGLRVHRKTPPWTHRENHSIWMDKSKEWSIWEIESGSHIITNFGISFRRSKRWIHIGHRCIKLPHWRRAVTDSRWRGKIDRIWKQSVISTWKELLYHQKRILAVVYFIVHFKHYLVGRHFQRRTDHGALTWLYSVLNSQKDKLLDGWRH